MLKYLIFWLAYTTYNLSLSIIHLVLWTNPLSTTSLQMSYVTPTSYTFYQPLNYEDEESLRVSGKYNTVFFWRLAFYPVVYLRYIFDFLRNSGLQLFVWPTAVAGWVVILFLNIELYLLEVIKPAILRGCLVLKKTLTKLVLVMQTVPEKLYVVSIRSPYNNARKLLWSGGTYKISAALFLTTYMYGLSNINTPLSHTLFANLVVFMPTYLIWQTFIYFTKTLTISKYTTQVAAFWQRTLYVFWSLEIIVFLIFVYIWFISPEVPKMFLGQTLDNSIVYVSIKKLVSIFIEVLTMLVISLYLLLSNNYRNILVQRVLVSLLLVGLLKLLLSEYHFFVYNSSKWTNLQTLVKLDGVEEKAYTIIKSSDVITTELTLQLNDLYTTTQIDAVREELFAQSTYSLIWFLRFWHVLLVFIIFSFTLFNYLQTNEISYEMLSVWVFHHLILIVFNFTYFIFYIKAVGKEYLVISPKQYYLDDISMVIHQTVLELLNLFS